MYTMHNRVDFEKQGTTEVVDIFLKEMLQAQVLEVQDIEYYRKQDVDVIAFKNDKRYKIEIKIDSKGDLTGNLFCETISNKTKGTKGCFVYTECDMWAYYLYNTKMLYFISMKEFREWVLSQEFGIFRKGTTATDVGNGNYYETEGLLVPIDEIINKAPMWVKVYDLNKKVRVH